MLIRKPSNRMHTAHLLVGGGAVQGECAVDRERSCAEGEGVVQGEILCKGEGAVHGGGAVNKRKCRGRCCQ